MMLSSRLQNIENTAIELRERHLHTHQELTLLTDRVQELTGSTHDTSTVVSQISSLVTEIRTEVEIAMKWARRIALGIGLAALSAQHLTIGEFARIMRIALGF